MPDFITFDGLFRIARDEVLARNARLSREAVEREGMDANILLAAAAAMADEVTGQISDLASSLFLDSASEEALDRLVFDRYGLTRKPAAAAIGSVEFRTAVPSPTTFSIPINTIVQTASGVQYVTTEGSTFLALSSGPLVVAVRSILAGIDQNSKAGTITSIVSVIPGAPEGLTVSNPFATVGGDDAEGDEALRDRAQRFFSTARRGTLSALESAALAVSGIRSATAFEALDALGRPARFVELVVADAFTEQFANLSTVPPRFETQSQVISSTVFNALAETRPAGTFVRVIVANVILQPVQLTLAFQAGSDVNSAALQARAAVVNYMNGLSPGSPFQVDQALDRIRLVPGLRFTGNEIFSPAGNVVARPLEVIRTTLGLVSAVAAQTDQPIITGDNPDAFVITGA